MLAAQIMGSNGGRQSLPFGYDPNEIHGIGLPDFSIPGPPPPPAGRPLLNEREYEHMDQFLTTFDEGPGHNHHDAHPQYVEAVSEPYNWTIPPTLVGSETSLRNHSITDWSHQHPMNNYQYGPDVNNMGSIQPQIHGFDHHTPYPHFFDQTHAMAHPTHNINNTYEQGWPQPYSDHTMHHTRPDLPFGSDPNFRASGYTHAGPPIEANMSLINYSLEARSTASNTQPNTQPNTEPSSPVVSKRRKLNDNHHHDPNANGYLATQRGHQTSQPSPPASNPRRHRKSFVKNEQPPTPLSKPQTPQERREGQEEDADAEYDDDVEADQTRSASPSTPWLAAKTGSNRVDRPTSSSKTAKSRRKSTSISSPVKSRPKSARASISSTAPTARTPLTAEQKKANHTNSEQRRRDATAKAYAELYDLVPELTEHGKQSTMKKLEIVVEKVQTVKNRVEQLRAKLGLDPADSTLPAANVSSAAQTSNELRSWQQ